MGAAPQPADQLGGLGGVAAVDQRDVGARLGEGQGGSAADALLVPVTAATRPSSRKVSRIMVVRS
ncbi:hypothetical protein [Rathayibacter oskolensis]|uniref:hypothetical protein n=1 Tax=Rathayibacter oskolensis TaxID=1891671 RepID=UPI0034677831